MTPIRVGTASPRNEADPGAYITVDRNGEPHVRIDVYSDFGGAFTELLTWGGYVVLGADAAAHFIGPESQQTRTVACDGYFGHFYPAGDRLLIASATELINVNRLLETEWRRGGLAIDGVVVNDISDDVTGEGEWDPPGGWRRFRLRLTTGQDFTGDA